MILVLLTGFLLVALTVAIHASGIALLVRWLKRGACAAFRGSLAGSLIGVAWAILILHGVEIALWALAFLISGGMPDLPTAFYFSGTTYTTIGYGDHVLEGPWRTLAPMEGITGILMCSLSGAFFFAVLAKRLGEDGSLRARDRRKGS